MNVNDVEWHWLPEPEFGGQPGEIAAKVFRAIGKLTDTEFLAREAVQNSWDAAQALRKSEKNENIPFSVTFRFLELTGEAKKAAVAKLGLANLNARRAEYGPEDEQPLREDTILDHLSDSRPLRLLYVEDRGSHGLYGALSLQRKSHLFKAMLTIGSSTKDPGAGGSFGFGKAALQKAGRLHTVFAHTAFQPFGSDPARSRFLGVTWWPSHDKDEQSYDGRALFANRQQQGTGGEPKVVPFVDAEADALAADLGFPTRDPANVNELGTTFLIVDPAVEPSELKDALEKWWWPALSLPVGLMNLSIVDYDGGMLIPQPAANPFVKQFLPAYRIALKMDEPSDPNKERRPSDGWRGGDFGGLGLVVPADPVNEDYTPFDGHSRVAMIRGPRMVIDYRTGYTPRRVPIIGAFVASEESNALLRKAEPASHTCWDDHPSTDIPEEATSRAKAVHSRVDKGVVDMVNAIVPPAPKDNRALATFSKLLSGFMGNKVGPPPPPTSSGEPIELRYSTKPTLDVVDPERLCVRAKFTVKVANRAPGDVARVDVGCTFVINEDEGAGGSKWDVTIKPTSTAHGFTKNDDGTWTGAISKRDPVTFVVESAPYSNLWSGTLRPTVSRTTEWSNA